MQENNNPKTIAIALLFGLFLALYFFTGLHSQSSMSLDDYPFGADTPLYLAKPITDKSLLMRHVTTVTLSNWLYSLPYGTKLLYSIIGALGVLVAYGVFSSFFGFGLSMLGACIYGLSLGIWFFSSFPESYIVTSFFISAYILVFLKIKDDMSLKKLCLLSGVLTLAVINDITSLMLLLVPAVYFAGVIFRDRRITRKLIVHALIVMTVSYGILATISYKYQNMSPFGYFSTLYTTYGNKDQQYTWRDMNEPLLNSLFFTIAAPEETVTFHTKRYPLYQGFFNPSLTPYLSFMPSLLLLAMYLFLLFASARRIYSRPREIGLFQLALWIFIVLRVIVFSGFVNPGEAFLYSSILVLPILVVLFVNFQALFPKYAEPFLAVFLILLLATNIRYFAASGFF